MFYVKLKGGNKIIRVYAVNKLYDLTQFLIYEDGNWIWVDSNDYELAY